MSISLQQLVSVLGNHQELMRECNPYFSQSGEDVILNIILRNEREKGIFVDIGAYHPFRFSNTFLLYLDGWRGVNVDANQGAIDAFNTIRPQDINIRALVSDKVEELEFCRYAEGAFNTANRVSIEGLSKSTNPQTKLVGTDRLTTMTPNQIFDQHVGSKKFDFLNIDIEGLDRKVLYSIDFSRYRPKAIAIEMDIQDWTSEPTRAFLANIRYSVHSQCYHTTILQRID